MSSSRCHGWRRSECERSVESWREPCARGSGNGAEQRACARHEGRTRVLDRLTIMKQRTGSILIVDDDDMAREVLRRRLSAQGYSVADVPNGREAITLIKKTAFDVLLLDIVMPEFDGLQTLAALRETHPANELPVIMLTAKEGSEDVVEALRLGANDYVTKSIPFSVVLARIQTQVTLRQLAARVEALAVRDPLTGLYNRRGFYQLAEKEEQRVRRYGGTLQAIMIDMDHFKKINDTHGHNAGDQVLAVTSRYCQQQLRTADLIGRWGGEEYAILLPGIDLAGAAKTAERLRTGWPMPSSTGTMAPSR